MTNKFLLITIFLLGIFFDNLWISLSIIPALILNLIIWVTITYARDNYHPIVKKQYLKRDFDELNNNIYFNIFVVFSRLSIISSCAYLIYLIYIKFNGILL